MGLAYYRMEAGELEKLRLLVRLHENEPVGPRARGYWFDYPDSYDFEGVRSVAQQLDAAGKGKAAEALEISEVEAQALSLLEAELPRDGFSFPPALFLCTANPDMVLQQLALARQQFGRDVERAASRFALSTRDKRIAGYLNKQLRHLRQALPHVWKLYERAETAGQGVLVVDLRARDLFEPEAVELEGYLYG